MDLTSIQTGSLSIENTSTLEFRSFVHTPNATAVLMHCTTPDLTLLLYPKQLTVYYGARPSICNLKQVYSLYMKN